MMTPMDDPAVVFPRGEPLYARVGPTGRSTVMAATNGDTRDPDLVSGGTRKAKISRLEETLVSETTFVNGAGGADITNGLANNRVSKLLGDISTSPAAPVRQFIDLYTNGIRVLPVIALHHPKENMCLDNGYCFLCKFSYGLDHPMALNR